MLLCCSFIHDQMSVYFLTNYKMCWFNFRDTTVQTLTLQPSVKDGLIVYEDSPLVSNPIIWMFSTVVFFLMIVVFQPLGVRECGISHRFQYISVLTGKHSFVCYLGNGYLIANYLGKITLFLTLFSLQSERLREWWKSSNDFFSIPEFKKDKERFSFSNV